MFDAHAHLQLVPDLDATGARIFRTATDPKSVRGAVFGPEDRAGVPVEPAGIVCCGTRPGDWDGVVKVAARFAFVRPFFGVHPWFIDELSEGWEARLDDLLAAGAAGVGEIGLDRLKNGTRGRRGVKMQIQRRVFAAQLEIAATHRLPVSIHCVHAWGAFFEDMEAYAAGGLRFMLHAFGGSVESALRAVGLGGYISFAPFNLGGPEGKTAAALRAVPEDRLLLDSDFPLRLDQGIGEYPGVVEDLLRRVANILGTETGELAKRVTANGSVFAQQTAVG